MTQEQHPTREVDGGGESNSDSIGGSPETPLDATPERPHEARPERPVDTNAARRRRLEEIVIPRARCPRCHSTDLVKYRSVTDRGDGHPMSWTRCRCGHRFRIVFE